MLPAKSGIWIFAGSFLGLYAAGLISIQDTNREQRDADHDQSQFAFEETLRLVIVGSRERFRPLKSFRVEVHPGRDYWYEVKVAFPGAESCRIYEHPELIYVCNWSTSKTKRASLPIDSDLVARLERSLGDAWTRTSMKSRLTAARFEPKRPTREGVIEVLLRENKTEQPGLQLIIHAPALRD